MQTQIKQSAAMASSRVGFPITLLCVVILLTGFVACKKDVGSEAIDTDANGYLCTKCGAKLYTDRTVFIGPKCPQCNQETLSEVVGYYCAKDNHLTIRASRGDSRGAVCEKCEARLANAMKVPREKDLKAWGATKVKG